MGILAVQRIEKLTLEVGAGWVPAAPPNQKLRGPRESRPSASRDSRLSDRKSFLSAILGANVAQDVADSIVSRLIWIWISDLFGIFGAILGKMAEV